MNNKSNIPPINWLEQNRTKRQMRTNPRNMKTNPRAKGTNPRAIKGNEMDTLSNKAILEKDNWNVIARKLKSKNKVIGSLIQQKLQPVSKLEKYLIRKINLINF